MNNKWSFYFIKEGIFLILHGERIPCEKMIFVQHVFKDNRRENHVFSIYRKIQARINQEAVLMKKILGIVGSYRKQGNTELFIKMALREVENHGIKTEMIRLTDYTIKPCKGCMACIFKGDRCRIDDDFYTILELIEESDGVLLGSPTYILGPQGQFKLFIDRFLVVPQHLDNLMGKPASTITASGLKRWNSLHGMLNMVVLGFGMKLIDAGHIYGPGPGQAILQSHQRDLAVSMGENLASAVKGKETEIIPVKTSPNACPICKGELYSPIMADTLECALCKTRATIKQDSSSAGFRLEFDSDSLENHRWTEEGLENHMEEWVKATSGMYKEKISDIKQIKAELRVFDRWKT